MSEVVAQTSMNDYRRIRTLPRYSRLKPSDTRRFHMESRRWLEDQAFASTAGKLSSLPTTRRAESRFRLRSRAIPAILLSHRIWAASLSKAKLDYGSMAISTIPAITRWAKPGCWPTREVIRPNRERVLILG